MPLRLPLAILRLPSVTLATTVLVADIPARLLSVTGPALVARRPLLPRVEAVWAAVDLLVETVAMIGTETILPAPLIGVATLGSRTAHQTVAVELATEGLELAPETASRLVSWRCAIFIYKKK